MTSNASSDAIEIQNLISRYSNCVNRRDWPALAELFAADAIWEVPGMEGMYFEGRAAITGGIPGLVEATTTLVQFNAPAVITTVGDAGTAHSTIRETGSFAAAGLRFEQHGIYQDDLARVDGKWCFVRRTFVVIENHQIPDPE